MAEVYRVDVSRLSKEQKEEVETKLKTISFMVLRRMDSKGLLIALDAIAEGTWSFESVSEFKNLLGLPSECTVIDVTGWDLLQ